MKSLVFVGIIAALLVGGYLYFNQNPNAQLQQENRELREVADSYRKALHNVLTPKPIGVLTIWDLSQMEEVKPEYQKCLKAIFRWADGSGLTLPANGKPARFCGTTKPPDTIGIGADLWLPNAAAQMSGVKPAMNLHYLIGVSDGIPIANTEILDPGYMGSEFSGDEIETDPLIVKACTWQEPAKPEDPREQPWKCLAGWQPGANWMQIAPGWGKLGYTQYVVLANNSGLDIVPLDDKWLRLIPRALGNIPPINPND